jgi:hypothetical protein
MMDFVNFAESSGARLFVAVIALSCTIAVFFHPTIVGGFSCGALAFCLAAVSLEQISRRALQLGDVRGGIKSGFLWVAVKFCGPAGAIFYGIWSGDLYESCDFCPDIVAVAGTRGSGPKTLK